MRYNGAWTKPTNGVPKIPKVRQFAHVTLMNGIVMNGYVFVDATARIQDVLNSATQFIPFIDETEVLHLIKDGSSKATAVRVWLKV